ncbi:GAF domain-containing SpoIIE family protein phosphatase [Streptomyces sp. NPDC047014]|uniref:GAF domain-containing SpoIIE family protein phosphatase n=1 Tax=Streptomyces sp. NPDC047014 TaxID=3155736 RepID=UPI003408E8D5
MNRFARLAARLLAASRGLVWVPDGVLEDEAPDDDPLGGESWPAGPVEPEIAELCRRAAGQGAPLALPGGPGLAFAGIPMIGSGGELLGVLAVTDEGPRTWSEDDLRDLGELAAACSAQMRLRSRSRAAWRGQVEAEEAAGIAEADADRMESLLGRAQLLLRAAEGLGDTSGLMEVCERVGELAGGDLKPSHVGLLLIGEDGLLRRVSMPGGADPWRDHGQEYETAADRPEAKAVREGRTVVIRDRTALESGYGPEVLARFEALGLQTLVCVPLPAADGILGVLALGWDIPHAVEPAERALLVVLADYTARAVERALYLDERISVARSLQEAMLTGLPAVGGLETAALYRPAARQDMVGGDWYDLYPLPGDGGAWAVTVGDITGHDMRAATVMGQVRSMLRQADHDHRGHPPHHAVEALVEASGTLGVPTGGTLVHGHLAPRPAGHWQLTWTNAGHPPPLLVHPEAAGAAAERMDVHDLLLHPSLPPVSRSSHTRLLPPGSTLLLYTDGLVEHRDEDLDDVIHRTALLLAEADPATPLGDVLQHLADTVAPARAEDDTVLLAVRVAPGREAERAE